METDTRIQKTAAALARVNLMIEDPGGDSWPTRFRLSKLPIETFQDQFEYVEAVETVLRGTDGLVAKTRPELEMLYRASFQKNSAGSSSKSC